MTAVKPSKAYATIGKNMGDVLMDVIVRLDTKDRQLNNVLVTNEEETKVLSLMGKQEVREIRVDPLNDQTDRALMKDDPHSLDDINPDHPVVDMENVRAMCVAHYREGQEVNRQVEAVIHHEKAIHLIVNRNGADFT